MYWYFQQFYAHPPIQSPTNDSKFKYNDKTLIGYMQCKDTSCTINTVYKMDERAWIRENTHYAASCITTTRLMHLQKTHVEMKWYKSSWCNWMTKDE